jgi:hypothetical protein
MVSEDSRSIRQKKSFQLSEFDFDTRIQMRCFLPNDVVQITIYDDPSEHYISLRITELPLNF